MASLSHPDPHLPEPPRLSPPNPAAHPPTDLELMLTREDLRLVPLRRGDRTLAKGLPSLGFVATTTANACVTCTRWGRALSVVPLEGGTAIFDQCPGLRWLGDTWRHSAAALRRDDPARSPTLLFFGEHGALAHRITLVGGEGWEAFQALVQDHRGCPCCLRHSPPPRAPSTSTSFPEPLLRAAWCESRSGRDLDTRLEALGLGRLQAVRALDGFCTAPMAPEDLARVLDRISTLALPTHVQVGNRHCLQLLECVLERVERRDGYWHLQGEDLLIRLDPAQVHTVWSVAQPGAGVPRKRLECYDGHGDRVLTLGAPLAPCPAIQDGWDRLLARA